MEYYGNNDWRGYLKRQNDLAHFGIPRRSGRYPWGSGEDPYHHGEDAPGSKKVRKLERKAYNVNIKSLKAKRRSAISNAKATKAQMRLAKRDYKNASNVEGLPEDQARLIRKEAKERFKSLKAENRASTIEAKSIAAEIKREMAKEKLRKRSEREKEKQENALYLEWDADEHPKSNQDKTDRMKTLEKMNNGSVSDDEIRKLVKDDLKSGYVKPDGVDRQAMRVDQAHGKLQGYSKALYEETTNQSAKPKASTDFDGYSDTLKRGEAISKSVLSNPERKLSKEEVWDLEDYADQLFYNNTGGPSESWSSKEAESEYYKLRKIIDKYN